MRRSALPNQGTAPSPLERRLKQGLGQATLTVQQAVQEVDRRAGHIPMPGWATPVAIATLAMLLLQTFDRQYVRGNLGWSVVVTGALIILFVALYIAIAHPDHRVQSARRRRFTSVLIGMLIVDTLIHIVMLVPHLTNTNRYSTDAGAATDCATQMVLHGRNPYVNLHMLMCLDAHGLHFSQTTPKSQGAFRTTVTLAAPDPATINWIMYTVYNQDLRLERADKQYPYHYAAPEFEERFNYPGGAILFGLIGWSIGTRDLVALYLVCAVAASLWVYKHAPQQVRMATGLLLLADLPLLLDSTNGVTDVLYALLLVVYWTIRDRTITSGLLLGLAAATRQQVWFFLPFFLYLSWRNGGWTDVRRRGLAMTVVFLACNLPFILQSPGDWLAGVLGPMRDPLFAQGIGLISLAIAVFKHHPGTPLFYTLLEAAAYLGTFKFFMRRCMTSPGLAMILPLMPIALAWRSLHTYFVVLPLLALAVLASAHASQEARRSLDAEPVPLPSAA